MRALIVIWIVCVGLVHVAPAQTELIGKTEAQVIAEKGKPVAKTVVGSKAIYRWDDAEVGFSNGKVTSVTPRNPDREAGLRQHSQKASQEAAKRKAAAEAKQKKDRAINERYLADSLAAQEKAARLEQQQKEEAETIARHAQYAEETRRRMENQQTEHLQVRPKTAKEQEAANAAATKTYNERKNNKHGP